MARSRGANARQSTGGAAFGTPVTRTTKIPLNDDNAEKAKRMKERSLLHSIQKDKMMAVASPASRRLTVGTVGTDGSPKTPRNIGMRNSIAPDGLLDAVTPLKRVPILANFEEWMKLATDNKINASNSWNFALIDYFHEMSLLREGDSVNFQKASCTLDGCVKIYTSRVDSVATETGKLLSGLADSSSKKRGKEDDDEAENGEGSDAEDGEGRPKPKKRAQRSSETTLAKDFSALQAKKFDLEFSVDPLFKKASADFDEGGAKGLLLNHLSIDDNGRIVFDSSDDRTERKEDEDEDDEEGEDVEKPAPVDLEDDDIKNPGEIGDLVGALGLKFFPDLDRLDNQDICPSLKNFDLGDPAGTLDIPFLKTLEERNENEEHAHANGGVDGNDGHDTGNGMAFGYDDGAGIGGDDDMTMAFGEGGEAWANETIGDAADRFMGPTKKPMGMGGSDSQAEFDNSMSRDFTVGFGTGHEDILAYFDDALRKNWAGPEHWKIRRIKEINKAANAPVRQRKEKEAFSIDFMDPAADIAAEILQPPKTLSTIALPKKDRISKTRHLLPDDKHFNSKQLLRLFLKPKASLSSRGKRAQGESKHDEPPENMDEEFWAKENMAKEIQASSTPGPNAPNYDANFFNDDPLALPAGLEDEDDEDIFADAREMFSPPPEMGVPSTQLPGTQATQGFGTQFLTQARRVRPEYVQYARVAKKVDVRRLKENIWSGLAYEPAPSDDVRAQKRSFDAIDSGADALQQQPQPPPLPLEEKDPEGSRKFTDTMRDLRRVYPNKTMADISTSYCFICLLHLANEKGLEISGEGQGLTDLIISKDKQSYGMAEGY